MLEAARGLVGKETTMGEGKIHIGKDVWTWKMPSSSYVIIRDPARMKTAVKPHYVFEAWWQSDLRKSYDPEHSWDERTFSSNITPVMVRTYIEQNLLPAKSKR
jgi:hypothetical protein